MMVLTSSNLFINKLIIKTQIIYIDFKGLKNMTEDIFDVETIKNDDLNNKLKQYFDGRIVRKDLTKKLKEGINVPVYVLEYLLGKYCSSDENLIDDGVNTVKQILSQNYVRPDEAEKIKSFIKERGFYSIIDVVSVKLNVRLDRYEASFSNLGLKNIPIDPIYPSEYQRLLGGNLWCMIKFEYYHDDADHRSQPFKIVDLIPIQLPSLDLTEIIENRKYFTKEEWIDVILKSCGYEPSQFDERVKKILLLRLIPLVENNFNLCELGPKGTGKSYTFKEISPNSLLVSGGKTTVANLFYNMSTREVGLVGNWDCVAFDEVAGIKFKDNNGIAIMKDYMESGSFSRGKDAKVAYASMVFVGNINKSLDTLLNTSNLFEPFPNEISSDSAFFDRMHCYIPGWEIPKSRPEYFTDDFGFISDFLAEYFREMRKYNYADSFEQYFELGHDLNQRDQKAVRKMVSGLIKILYPDENYDKDDIAEILELALESRRRVKEQLKRIGGMEFNEVNFSYKDKETDVEKYIQVQEQGSSTLVPATKLNPGHLFTSCQSLSGKTSLYKIETEMIVGNGKLDPKGLGSKKEVKEAADIAFSYLKSNHGRINSAIDITDKNYVMQLIDMTKHGVSKHLTLATLISICSVASGKSVLGGLCVLGDFTIGGNIQKVDNLPETLQLCKEWGVKKILIPKISSQDLGAVLDIWTEFDPLWYEDPVEAVMKALGVE